jgi:hypothetical protein
MLMDARMVDAFASAVAASAAGPARAMWIFILKMDPTVLSVDDF